jgi:hypothetical protein
MKIPFAIALVVSLQFEAAIIAQDAHVIRPDTWSRQSVSPRVADKRLERVAMENRDRGQLSRVAIYDIAFPADADEYRSLGGYAVMMVSAIAQAKDELPPKRVYVRMPDAIIELQLITSASSKVAAGTTIAKAFGMHRWDGLYLFPVNARRHGVELVMDFARNRDGFVMQRFGPAGLEALVKLPDADPSKVFPPEAPLRELITREFPGVFEPAAPAETPPAEEESRVPGY